MFQVGEFGRLAGASPKVLRDYDRLGLFRPAWVDRASGYRRYSPAQLPELRRILALRDLGVSLSEIRALTLDGTDLRVVLERRRAALEAQRREIDRRLTALGISIGDASGGDAPGDAAGLDVVIRRVPAELVATLAVEAVGGDEGRAFYLLERSVRDAGVRAPRPPGTLVGEAGPEVFVPVRRAARGLATRRLPAIDAATVLHHGSYAGLAATQARLQAWLLGADLAARGPLRILYLQFGAESDLRLPARYVVDRASDLVTELQLPLG